jgi:ubiquitin-activating enzyme E1
MLLLRSSLSFLCLFNVVQAGPIVRLANSLYHKFHDSASPSNTTIIDGEDCQNYCGLDDKICCAVGASCLMDSNGNSECGTTHLEARQAGSGFYEVYTSTWVITDVATNYITMTSLVSSWMSNAQAFATTCTPNTMSGQVPCGPKCCDNGFYCINTPSGVCTPFGNDFTTGVVIVGGGTVGIRPTVISGITLTQTIQSTFTTGIMTAATGIVTNGTVIQTHHTGLSAGAIAGIVIGVLLGVSLLLLICFCCCLKAGIEGLLGFFGLGGRRRSRRSSRETIVEEEVIRRHRGGTAASGSRRWAGSGSGSYDRYSRRPVREKKSSGWAPLAALGGLGGLFALNRAKKSRQEKSYSSSSYDYYSG